MRVWSGNRQGLQFRNEHTQKSIRAGTARIYSCGEKTSTCGNTSKPAQRSRKPLALAGGSSRLLPPVVQKVFKSLLKGDFRLPTGRFPELRAVTHEQVDVRRPHPLLISFNQYILF